MNIRTTLIRTQEIRNPQLSTLNKQRCNLLVSIIIPCYNTSGYVRKAVESALAQTHQDIEVICVNDGSTDDTWEALQALAQEYPQLVLVDKENGGAPSARNRGLQESTGTYVQFLDSDDHLHPEKLAHQLRCAESAGGTDILVGGYQRVDEAGKEVITKRFPNLNPSPWPFLIRTDMGITSSNLFSKQALDRVGGWDEGLKSSQEYDLMFRILQAGGKAISDDGEVHTVIVTRGEGSISSDSRGANWERYIDLRCRMRDHLREVAPEWLAEADQQIFDAIRQLYPYDSERAKELLGSLLPTGYRPGVSGVTSPFYLKLYRLLGLSGAESVRSLLGR